MSSQQQIHFMRQPCGRAHAVALVQEQNQHKIIMMVIYALASAIIALWMAYWPIIIGSIPTNLNILPQQSSASDSVNRVNKDGRFTRIRFDDRWNALAAMTIRTLGENGAHARATDPAKDTQRIPVGCEPAFSPLVQARNFTARCLS